MLRKVRAPAAVEEEEEPDQGSDQAVADQAAYPEVVARALEAPAPAAEAGQDPLAKLAVCGKAAAVVQEVREAV